MSPSPFVLAELTSTGLTLGFAVWVLAVQPIALVRGMPRSKFLGLQMRVVRAWGRTLVPLALAGALAAVARTRDVLLLVPASVALAAAVVAAGIAIPRAIRAGGESAHADEDPLTEQSFLSRGGGSGTRIWHRVVLVCALALLGGRSVAAYTALSCSCGACDVPAVAGAAVP